MTLQIRMGALGLVLLLAGCGFHLRGSGVDDIALSDMPMVYLQSGNPQSGMLEELRRRGGLQGARFTLDSAAADLALNITSERFDRRVLSVGGAGKVSEYEVHYAISYSVLDNNGEEKLANRISLVRDYRFDETQVLGKEAEEKRLRQDMVQDAAQQIMRQLRTIR
ncbi:MAG: LPS assembly lipoprotein LptE [Gammaproteobacteria bacterium]|nr:LPS assembly lipoprotein LptE [Gammaproteobacteria bacterium]